MINSFIAQYLGSFSDYGNALEYYLACFIFILLVYFVLSFVVQIILGFINPYD